MRFEISKEWCEDAAKVEAGTPVAAGLSYNAVIARAAAEYASWPAWKREAAEALVTKMFAREVPVA